MIKFTRRNGERVVTDDYKILRDAVKNGDVSSGGCVEIDGYAARATYHTACAEPLTVTIIVREPQILVLDLLDTKKRKKNDTIFLQGLTVGTLIASAVFAPVAALMYDRTRDEIAALRLELEQNKQLHAHYAEKNR